MQLRELQDTKQELGLIVAREESLQKDLAQSAQERNELRAQLATANEALEEGKREIEARNDR